MIHTDDTRVLNARRSLWKVEISSTLGVLTLAHALIVVVYSIHH
jgi:hypothetical protein